MIRSVLRILPFVVAVSSQSVPSWVQLGSTLTHDAIQAISLDFDDLNMGSASFDSSAPTQGKGLPVVAYGYYNTSTQGSSINIISYQSPTMNQPIVNNQSSQGTWTIIAQHTPQFAQPYDNFNFKVRNNGLLYLGLRIDEKDFTLSSVLKGTRGINKPFEGCYAFNGYVFDYDINDMVPNIGDIKLITSPDNLTLAFATYGHSGYNTYPAGDTWGPYNPISPALPTNQYGIDNVMITTQFTLDRSTIFIAYDQNSHTSVGAVSLQNNTVYQPYTNTPFDGNLVGITYTPWVSNVSTGLVCIALSVDNGSSSSINIVCLYDTNNGSIPSSTAWVNIGAPLTNIRKHDDGMGVPLGFTSLQYNTTHVLIVTVGLDATDDTLLKSGWILCSNSGALTIQCSSTWTTGPIVQTQQTVNNLQLSSPSVWQGGGLKNILLSDTVILVVSEGVGQNGPGDTLSIYGMLFTLS